MDDYDLDRDRFARLLARFSRATAGAGTALVFYAGHGMELSRRMISPTCWAPTNAEIDCETREHFNTIKLRGDHAGHSRRAQPDRCPRMSRASINAQCATSVMIDWGGKARIAGAGSVLRTKAAHQSYSKSPNPTGT